MATRHSSASPVDNTAVLPPELEHCLVSAWTGPDEGSERFPRAAIARRRWLEARRSWAEAHGIDYRTLPGSAPRWESV